MDIYINLHIGMFLKMKYYIIPISISNIMTPSDHQSQELV